jgi:2Fe-2S ferredoxin
MLDMTAEPRRPTSRLSCQLVLDPTLDGLVAGLPESQY